MSSSTAPTRHKIVVCAGDYCGPEVVAEAIKVLLEVERQSPQIILNLVHHPIGGAAWNEHGENISEAALEECASASAMLVGAVGGPEWRNVVPGVEWGLGRLRKRLGAFGNIRPVRTTPSLLDHSALKAEICTGTDITILRELTGGIYFGARHESDQYATDTDVYTRAEIQRATRLAGILASRSDPPRRITSVDKATVLAACGRLWRSVVDQNIAMEFPNVSLQHVSVNSAAMDLISSPRKLNGILLTSNMFGDILSDEAGAIVGSIGLLPSASLSDLPTATNPTVQGLYEPVHGSAPDLCGSATVNPIGAILSVAMMCRYSLGLERAAQAIEDSVESVLQAGIITPDLGGCYSTSDVGDAVLARLHVAHANAGANNVECLPPRGPEVSEPEETV